MRMIYCDLLDIGVFWFEVVDAEKINVLWAVNSIEGDKYVPSKVYPSKLIPYSDEVLIEIATIKQIYDELWEHRMNLTKYTVQEAKE